MSVSEALFPHGISGRGISSPHRTRTRQNTIRATCDSDTPSRMITAIDRALGNVAASLLGVVYGSGVSTEAVLRVSYQPLAVFRVRPVTRCTSTMPGHTEAVLHVSYSPDGSMLASGSGDMTVR